VGLRAERQAADAAGDLGTIVHVDRGHLELALPNLLYRLSETPEGTRIAFTHTLVGPFPDEHRPQLASGWAALHARVRQAAESTGNQEDR
jgi:hypothetical protein